MQKWRFKLGSSHGEASPMRSKRDTRTTAVSYWYRGQAGAGEDKCEVFLWLGLMGKGTSRPLLLYVWALLKAGGTLPFRKENGLVSTMLGTGVLGATEAGLSTESLLAKGDSVAGLQLSPSLCSMFFFFFF